MGGQHRSATIAEFERGPGPTITTFLHGPAGTSEERLVPRAALRVRQREEGVVRQATPEVLGHALGVLGLALEDHNRVFEPRVRRAVPEVARDGRLCLPAAQGHLADHVRVVAEINVAVATLARHRPGEHDAVAGMIGEVVQERGLALAGDVLADLEAQHPVEDADVRGRRPAQVEPLDATARLGREVEGRRPEPRLLVEVRAVPAAARTKVADRPRRARAAVPLEEGAQDLH
mmetsp:Transcript_2984/g.8727  ORF Transcript_2984/g.8727 Transcript_2984/m.8727 type:complete len:233 (+) Transcript_2984:136-834(+)